MKILLCTNTFRNVTNGPTKFANLLYQNGKKNSGLEVHILTEDIKEDGERLYRCKLGILKKLLPLAPVYRMFKYYRKASKLNKLNRFDYVIYNNAIYGVIHAYLKANIVGMINDDNNQNNVTIARSHFEYSFLKKVIFKWFEKMAIIFSKRILTNSDYLTDLLMSSYPDNASKIVRLYKGLELDTLISRNRSDWNVENLDCIQILFVKNDFLRGGIRILAESLSAINFNFSVTVIGPGDKDSGLIKSFFSAPNTSLVFLGIQTQEKVFELMATHHIFCVPSLQEALGVANLEALNIGIPVVSSDAGGLNEVLDYGNCGFISKAGDAHSLRSNIELCLFDKELRLEKVVNGYEHVKKFKKEFLAENLQNILNEAI